MDSKSIEQEIILELVHLQHLRLGTALVVQKGNKSVASPNVPRQGTQTLGRQDGRAPARAYAMKAMEDTDASDVIAGNIQIFDTLYMH